MAAFEYLPQIRNALQSLHSVIKVSEIRNDWPTFVAPDLEYPTRDDEIIFVQRVASIVARHYRLSGTTFVVSFNPALQSVAKVEVSKSSQIFVEYNHSGRISVIDLWPTMAHEIAHIFLNRIGVNFEDTLQNEVLTDVATVYLGFGALYLSAQREDVTGVIPRTNERPTAYATPGYTFRTYTTRRLGYLSPEEMGYVLAQRDLVRGEDSLMAVRSDDGKESYKRGKAVLSEEKNCRPYSRRSLFDRLLYEFGLQRKREIDGITFRCVFCKQLIRIPALHKTLAVACSNCGGKLRCHS